MKERASFIQAMRTYCEETSDLPIDPEWERRIDDILGEVEDFCDDAPTGAAVFLALAGEIFDVPGVQRWMKDTGKMYPFEGVTLDIKNNNLHPNLL